MSYTVGSGRIATVRLLRNTVSVFEFSVADKFGENIEDTVFDFPGKVESYTRIVPPQQHVECRHSLGS